jgi:hypothetical protein
MKLMPLRQPARERKTLMGKAKKIHKAFPESKPVGTKGSPRPLRHHAMLTVKEAREKPKTRAKAKKVAK